MLRAWLNAVVDTGKLWLFPQERTPDTAETRVSTLHELETRAEASALRVRLSSFSRARVGLGVLEAEVKLAAQGLEAECTEASAEQPPDVVAELRHVSSFFPLPLPP